MSYLLANGCSFTNKNYNTNSHGYYHTIEEKKRLGIPLEDWPMWPEYVADKLELLHNNLGQNGRSNEIICNDTILECHLNKPKLIMVLWSSGWRRYFLGSNLIHNDFVMAIQIANTLIKYSDEITTWTKKLPIDKFVLAFEVLKHYYLDSYDRCLNFYSKKSNLVENMYSLESIMNARNKWTKYPALMFTNYYMNLYNTNASRKDQMEFISDELRPILNLYEYCKSENISLVSACVMPFGTRPSTMKLVSKYKYKSAITVFDKMLVGLDKLNTGLNNTWSDNFYFKRIDDLVSDKKYIIYNWPNHPALMSANWPPLKGWKKVSYRDSHPHWDTQKKIGDLFYDLYKKNYT